MFLTLILTSKRISAYATVEAMILQGAGNLSLAHIILNVFAAHFVSSNFLFTARAASVCFLLACDEKSINTTINKN
jgi:hypothetical protein